MLKFTKDHEWLRIEGDEATVGITRYAVEQLGDLVFVQLPDVDSDFATGDGAAVVESVKAASDVYAPLDGSIVEINEAIAEDPSIVNSEPEGAGWFFKMKLKDIAAAQALMDKDAYDKLIAEEGA